MGKQAVVIIESEVKGTNRIWYAEVGVQIVDSNENRFSARHPTRLLYSKTFTGSAVRHPDDREKDDVGCQMALGRALESAGKRLQKIAWHNIEDRPKADVVQIKAKKSSGKKAVSRKRKKSKV